MIILHFRGFVKGFGENYGGGEGFFLKVGIRVETESNLGLSGRRDNHATPQIYQWGRGPMGVSPMLPTVKSFGLSMPF